MLVLLVLSSLLALNGATLVSLAPRQPQYLVPLPTTYATGTQQQQDPVPTTFQTSLPTLITSSPAQHLSNFIKTFFPHIRPVTGGEAAPATPTTYYYVAPTGQQQAQQTTSGVTQGTSASGQPVLYYYYYPQGNAQGVAPGQLTPQGQLTNTAYSYAAPGQLAPQGQLTTQGQLTNTAYSYAAPGQLAPQGQLTTQGQLTNTAYSYAAPTSQQQQPNTFSYYIHPASYAQPSATTV